MTERLRLLILAGGLKDLRSASGTAEQADSQEGADRSKTKTRKTETTYSPFERFLLNGETK
jgi:hypothetical protein